MLADMFLFLLCFAAMGFIVAVATFAVNLYLLIKGE
jgi:hypothetical protein